MILNSVVFSPCSTLAARAQLHRPAPGVGLHAALAPARALRAVDLARRRGRSRRPRRGRSTACRRARCRRRRRCPRTRRASTGSPGRRRARTRRRSRPGRRCRARPARRRPPRARARRSKLPPQSGQVLGAGDRARVVVDAGRASRRRCLRAQRSRRPPRPPPRASRRPSPSATPAGRRSSGSDAATARALRRPRRRSPSGSSCRRDRCRRGKLMSPNILPRVQRGYADILGDDDPTGSGVGQRAMISRLVPRIYERVWRPVLAPLLMAGRRDERAMALEMLAIGPGDSVLDVGCGPGQLHARVRAREPRRPRRRARRLAHDARAGGARGQPAERALRARRRRRAAVPGRDVRRRVLLRGAVLHRAAAARRSTRWCACSRPAGGSRCWPAWRAARCRPGVVDAVVRRATGTRVFGPDELTGALAERGLTAIDRQLAGMAQFVSARARR